MKAVAGFYQFNPAFGEKERNIEKVRDALCSIEADLVVLPEFFATGYQFVSSEEVSELAEAVPGGMTTGILVELSRKKNMYIIAGLAERAGDAFFNSAVITGPEGFMGCYRKTHLFYEEKLFFSPGDNGFRVWKTGIGNIGVMICFDWFFPESMRTLALMGADIIAHPSNLVLQHCPGAMPVRCLENRVYAITANRTGKEDRKDGDPLEFIGMSQVVAPSGEVVIRASGDEEVLLVTEVDAEESKNKQLNEFNDLLKDRCPDLYRLR